MADHLIERQMGNLRCITGWIAEAAGAPASTGPVMTPACSIRRS
ncbi:hypothetical protein ACFWDI_09390 [Streptomyces sp. NPDC060064]